MPPRIEWARNGSLSLALAQQAYETNHIRLVCVDLESCTHLVATRRGLFAVNPEGSRLIAFGLFYGITIEADLLYAFEACALPRENARFGRIVRLRRRGNRIVAADVIATGLSTGCHQIDIIDGRLIVLDTYNQAILRFSGEAEKIYDTLYPLPPARRNAWSEGYAHINSVLSFENRHWLMLHNGAKATCRASEIAICDKDWHLIERQPLEGHGCHNLAILEDGVWLACGSLAGELISSDGLRLVIAPGMMTRGLSVDETSIVVGASPFAPRDARLSYPGRVIFIGRDYRVTATIDIPCAPTEIRRIDGQDRSLSAYLAKGSGAAREATKGTPSL